MEALPASFQACLSSFQLLTLQLLGRSPVPDVPDYHHLLPGPALQRTDRARCHLPSKLRPGTAAAAVPADAPGPHHPAPGLQHACGGRGEAAPGCHQLPERTHRPALSHHRLSAVCRVLFRRPETLSWRAPSWSLLSATASSPASSSSTGTQRPATGRKSSRAELVPGARSRSLPVVPPASGSFPSGPACLWDLSSFFIPLRL